MRKTDQDIITLNAKIGAITRESIEIRQTPIFNEQATCGYDEEGDGATDETPAGGGDEETTGEDDEHLADACNKEAGDEEPPHENDKVLASHHQSVCIDDDSDDEGEVPLAILPLRSFVGDPTTTVDVDQLSYVVTVRNRQHR